MKCEMKCQQVLQALLVSCAVTCVACMRTPLSDTDGGATGEPFPSHEEQVQQREGQYVQWMRVRRSLLQEGGGDGTPSVGTGNAGVGVGVTVFFIVFFGALAWQFRRQIATSCRMCVGAAAAANAAQMEKQQVKTRPLQLAAFCRI